MAQGYARQCIHLWSSPATWPYETVSIASVLHPRLPQTPKMPGIFPLHMRVKTDTAEVWLVRCYHSIFPRSADATKMAGKWLSAWSDNPEIQHQQSEWVPVTAGDLSRLEMTVLRMMVMSTRVRVEYMTYLNTVSPDVGISQRRKR